MNEHLKNDLVQLDILLDKVKLQGLEYLKKIESRQTSTKNTIEQNVILNEKGIGTIEALQQFNGRFEPIIVSTSGPRYWGFVVGGSTPASIVGDWLTSIYDQNPFATKGQGDISALIELETIQLLLNLFELPNDYFGGFVTGATMSNFTCLAVARQWIGKELGKDFAKEGVAGNIKILTATPHSSALKSLSMLGIGSNNFSGVKLQEGNKESIDINDLEERIKQLNDEPFILISSGGTVNTVDFDNLKAIAKLKEKYNFWWHIDAAFGAFAICSDNHKHLLSGWEFADSITVDCHKWLNVPYDSGVVFVRDEEALSASMSTIAAYIPTGSLREPFQFVPEMSRQARAIPVWAALKSLGKKGLADMIDKNCRQAVQFADALTAAGYTVLNDVILNQVLVSFGDAATTIQVIKKVQEEGICWCGGTVWQNKTAMRISVSSWSTSDEDVQKSLHSIIKQAKSIVE